MKLKEFLENFKGLDPNLEIVMIDYDDKNRHIDLDKTLMMYPYGTNEYVISFLSTHKPDNSLL